MSNNLEPIMGVMARVRRAMPRNADVMLICDELERLIQKPKPTTPRLPASMLASLKKNASRPRMSRAEIQRNYRIRKKEQGK